MITLDTLRAAALSAQPWTELDRLVRAELAAGRLTKTIADEILALADAVSESPGFTEDADEAIGDTVDALIGFCSADCAYRNPPVLPSEKEIAALPRWARVAFGARCAKRVLPLYRHFWRDARPDRVKALTRTVSDLEKWGIASYHPDTEAHDATENNATDSAVVVETIRVAVMAASRHGSATADQDLIATSDVRAAATQAATAAQKIIDLSSVIRRDFDHLAELARRQNWADDTPVPPEVFGPLWPEGPPRGWPEEQDGLNQSELPLRYLAQRDTASRTLEDEVVNLFNALNEYHVARTGVRLTLDGDISTRLAQLVGVGV